METSRDHGQGYRVMEEPLVVMAVRLCKINACVSGIAPLFQVHVQARWFIIQSLGENGVERFSNLEKICGGDGV